MSGNGISRSTHLTTSLVKITIKELSFHLIYMYVFIDFVLKIAHLVVVVVFITQELFVQESHTKLPVPLSKYEMFATQHTVVIINVLEKQAPHHTNK